VILAVVVVVIVIQVIPVDRSNPPVQGEIRAPAAVSEVLRTSCYDCHSNETKWPWYSRVAPLSWAIAHHIHEGRDHLNFSEWGALGRQKQMEITREIREETSEGKMPLRSYLIIHRDAKLTDDKLEIIRAWSLSSSGEDVSD